MFLFYADESGHTGSGTSENQPVLVIAGLLINAYRHGKTHREFAELLERLSSITKREVAELKGADLFRGRGQWKGIDAEDRAAARLEILSWIAERNHKVVATGLVLDRWPSAEKECPELKALSRRTVATLHAALSVQRNQHAKKLKDQNKNLSLLVFDRQDPAEEKKVQRLIASPEPWMLNFVKDKVTGFELDALVDTIYFADSTQAPLLQVADFLAYMVQRKCSLHHNGAETFAGERKVIDDVFKPLKKLFLAKSSRLPSGKSELAKALHLTMPEPLT